MANRVGQQLGNYRLVRLIGQGGFAEVYLGKHKRLKTSAAIKVLRAQLTQEGIASFQQEAEIIACLVHPHIVRVLDYDVAEGAPFLVMEYAPNGTLRQHYPKGQPIAPTELVPTVLQIADALQYAHAQKLVHRDIKPENMLLGEQHQVLLSDFGIAIMAQSTNLQKTQEVAGTAAYMSPEQLQGKPRPASDLYSLAVVVYEWLAGTRPFQGSFAEVASQHLFTPPPPLREKVPMLAPAVEEVVLTALAKDPKARFASAQAFATAFDQASRRATPVVLSPATRSEASLAATLQGNASLADERAVGSAVPVVLVQTELAAPTPASETPPPDVLTPLIAPPEPEERQGNVSRRAMLVGAAGLGGLAVVGGVAAWFKLTQPLHTSSLDAHSTAPVSSTLTPAATSVPYPTFVTTPVFTYRGHRGALELNGLAWSPERGGGIQRIASGGVDGLQVWDALTGVNAAVLWNEDIVGVGWSPNGQLLAFDNKVDGATRIVNMASRATAATYVTPGPVSTWSPDGQRLAGGSYPDPLVWIWTWQTPGATPTLLRGHTKHVNHVVWSPDGTYLASASEDQTVRLWNASTGALVRTLDAQAGIAWEAAWSPDSTHLVTGHDGSARVWDVKTGQQLSLVVHAGSVSGLTWSPDGSRIASTDYGSKMYVWNAITGNILVTYGAGPGHIASVTWSPDGQYLATGRDDTTVQIWQAG